MKYRPNLVYLGLVALALIMGARYLLKEDFLNMEKKTDVLLPASPPEPQMPGSRQLSMTVQHQTMKTRVLPAGNESGNTSQERVAMPPPAVAPDQTPQAPEQKVQPTQAKKGHPTRRDRASRPELPIKREDLAAIQAPGQPTPQPASSAPAPAPTEQTPKPLPNTTPTSAATPAVAPATEASPPAPAPTPETAVPAATPEPSQASALPVAKPAEMEQAEEKPGQELAALTPPARPDAAIPATLPEFPGHGVCILSREHPTQRIDDRVAITIAGFNYSNVDISLEISGRPALSFAGRMAGDEIFLGKYKIVVQAIHLDSVDLYVEKP